MPEKLKQIKAPYNFVPLSGWVFEPDWAPQVSHDVPFSNGLSGRLDIEITAHTPILVGGKQNKATANSPGEVHFFQLPDKRYAIPGTSLKGMIRNVLEIASFGKMQFVDDRRLSIRDISGRRVIGNNYKIEGQQAGFLRLRQDSIAEIIPCQFVHISHRDMEKMLNWNSSSYLFTKDDTAKVSEKYQVWKEQTNQNVSDDSLPTLSFNINSNATPKMATDLGNGQHTGTLVFTGQISDKGQTDKGKYRDFVFYNRNEQAPKEVEPRILKDFFYIHGDEDKKSTGSWRNFWRDRFFNSQSHEIPVFYHVDEHEQIRSIGLAYMYRLAYHYSIGETIDYTNENHRKQTGYDLADLLFGKVHPDDQQSQESLKSRVSFGAATVVGTPQLAAEKYSEPTILNGPKPTYFPNYIRQDDIKEVVNENAPYQLHQAKQYRTYMQPDSEIRGWKRYPVRRWEQVNVQKPPQKFRGRQKDNKEVQVRLFPLQKGTQFQSSIHFHNLRAVELGALIWTLTWGHDDRFCHNIGMGKGFGFGQVTLKMTDNDIRTAKAPDEPIVFDEQDYLSLFRTVMQNEYNQAKHPQVQGKWGDSEQIIQLKAMAYPEHRQATAEQLQHLRLEDEQGQNQFVKAKQQGWVLPEYGYKRYQRDTYLFPRTSRKPKPKPATQKPTLPSTAPAADTDKAKQWIDATLHELKNAGRLPANLEAIFSKHLAEKWQQIEEVDFKNQVREQISHRWTNTIPDKEVDWWKVPPTQALKRAKKIYEQESKL